MVPATSVAAVGVIADARQLAPAIWTSAEIVAVTVCANTDALTTVKAKPGVTASASKAVWPVALVVSLSSTSLRPTAALVEMLRSRLDIEVPYRGFGLWRSQMCDGTPSLESRHTGGGASPAHTLREGTQPLVAERGVRGILTVELTGLLPTAATRIWPVPG